MYWHFELWFKNLCKHLDNLFTFVFVFNLKLIWPSNLGKFTKMKRNWPSLVFFFLASLEFPWCSLSVFFYYKSIKYHSLLMCKNTISPPPLPLVNFNVFIGNSPRSDASDNDISCASFVYIIVPLTSMWQRSSLVGWSGVPYTRVTDSGGKMPYDLMRKTTNS